LEVLNQPKYRPHKKQLEFHNDAYKVFYRLVSCGTGSGKTLCGLAEDISWCLDNYGIVGVVFEPTYHMVQWTLIPALESDWLLGTPVEANPLVKKFNRSSLKLEFVTGSVLWFGSLDKPERAEGPNLDFVHVDEARLVRSFDLAWQVLTRRLRGSNSAMPYPRGAWITTTPDAPTSPLYNFFEHPSTKDPEAKVYRWSIYDNPALPPEFLRQIERSHHDSLAERFIYGRFAVAGVGSFEFDATIHVREIAPMLLKEIRYGVDFGWTNPTAIVALGYDGDGRVWVLDEVYQRQMRQEDIVQALIEFRQKYGEGDILCDPSNPETIDALRRAELNASGYHAKREDGLREFGGRFGMAGDGQPRIFVSKLCVNLTSELLEYREDVKENDHAVDAVRYALKLRQSALPGTGAVMLPH
jgi:phage terminase large subunit-like protein